MKLFDLDGTLIDSNGVWVDIDLAFLERRGIVCTDDYTEYVSHTTYQNAAAYTKERFGLEQSVEEILREWSDMAAAAYETTIPAKPGVLAYLENERRRGERLGIVTSCMEHLCHAALKRLGIFGLFEQITTVREVTRDKKHPDIYLLAAKKAGLPPAACTMFEDSPSAAAGAKAAGMTVVGVYDPFFAPFEAELKKTCDRYIASFEELLTP